MQCMLSYEGIVVSRKIFFVTKSEHVAGEKAEKSARTLSPIQLFPFDETALAIYSAASYLDTPMEPSPHEVEPTALFAPCTLLHLDTDSAKDDNRALAAFHVADQPIGPFSLAELKQIKGR